MYSKVTFGCHQAYLAFEEVFNYGAPMAGSVGAATGWLRAGPGIISKDNLLVQNGQAIRAPTMINEINVIATSLIQTSTFFLLLQKIKTKLPDL